MKKLISTAILTLFITTYTYSVIDKKKAVEIASKTLAVITDINMILNKVQTKNHINKEIKVSLKKQASMLKKLKLEIKHLRSISEENMKALNREFKHGRYARALQKAIKNLFMNVKRLKKINGGNELVKIIAL